MPGSRLNDVERRLKGWWNSPSTQFPFQIVSGISVKSDPPGLRGITDLDISFEYPLTVICGQNGSGKTTLLALAALAFHAPNGHHSYQARNYKPQNPKSYYTFVDFFFKGIRDPVISGVEITWRYGGSGITEKTITKQSKKWMKYETRPKRPVHYFGESRILPAIEKNVLRGHFRINRSQHNSVILNDYFRGIFCRILNRNYSDATVTKSDKYSLRSCECGSTYTSFNMGAGEDTLMEMLYRLQEAPNGSLIVIEEIELGLHPEAQIKFAEELLKIAWDKKFQIIASSHSSEFIDHVPRISRILIQRTGNGTTHNIVKAPTTRYAMGFLQGDTQYELMIYSEDAFAERILKKAMCADLRRRVHVIGVGGKEQVAKQCGAHVRASWPGKYLGVFDGEVAQTEIDSFIRKEFPSIDNTNSVNNYTLPGGLPPEKWVIREILEDSVRLEDLKSELEENNIETVRGYLQGLDILSNHHYIGYEFSKVLGLDQKEAEDILIKIACKNNSKLSSFVDKVRMILDNPLQVSY